jgi:hypothetical protein
MSEGTDVYQIDVIVVATTIAATRAQTVGFARDPGLVGINKKEGVVSLEAVLDDMARAVASGLGLEGEAYRRFLAAARP